MAAGRSEAAPPPSPQGPRAARAAAPRRHFRRSIATTARRRPGHGNGAAPARRREGNGAAGGAGQRPGAARGAGGRAPGLLSGTAAPRPPRRGPRSASGRAVVAAGVLWCPLSLQAEVEETLKRIQAHKGVIATMVINAEGKTSSASSEYQAW